MARAYNFCAGPAALPEPVLAKARDELLEWRGQGASVMEVSHRSKAFEEVAAAAEASLRRLLGISDDYAVLFLQGGASQQFAAVPMNLANQGDAADYLVTGQWSKKAYAEGARFVHANLVADGAP
ncbi:MAG: aminotransferase class V-fold PLP-dependent enzyme, partial [Luminiphilus sp.]